MKRIIEIDGLRALATVLLLLHHAGVYQFEVFGFTLKFLIRTQMGFAILGTFFLLSGFLLGHNSQKQPRLKLGRYYSQRLQKLYPPYILAVFLFLTLLPIQLEAPDFWYHIFGLQLLFAPTYSTPVITLWYFGLLVLLLLIVPIGLARWNNLVHSFLYLLTVFTFANYIHTTFGIIEIRFFYFFWIFATGALVGKYPINASNYIPSSIRLGFAIIIFLITGYWLFLRQTAYIHKLDWGHIATANLFMLSFVYLAYEAMKEILRLPRIRGLMSRIARGSYFTYMYHRPIWALLFLPFGISEGPVLFLLRFFLGAPIILFIMSWLQPKYESLIRNKNRS